LSFHIYSYYFAHPKLFPYQTWAIIATAGANRSQCETDKVLKLADLLTSKRQVIFSSKPKLQLFELLNQVNAQFFHKVSLVWFLEMKQNVQPY
jgi:hypothetical protein